MRSRIILLFILVAFIISSNVKAFCTQELRSTCLVVYTDSTYSEEATEDEENSIGGKLIVVTGEDSLNFSSILAKYKGKVVYVDFWASWCGPCRAEMEVAKKLKRKMKKREVVFLYFSIDEDIEACEKAIKTQKIKGEHYLLFRKAASEMKAKYNIESIPRYMLVDKNGVVTNTDAKRPSDEKLIMDFEKLLR